MPWNGSVIVSALSEEEYEKQRERWITKGAGGKERVYVRDMRGQPVPRQEVIRISQEDWCHLEKEFNKMMNKRMGWGIPVALSPFLIFALEMYISVHVGGPEISFFFSKEKTCTYLAKPLFLIAISMVPFIVFRMGNPLIKKYEREIRDPILLKYLLKIPEGWTTLKIDDYFGIEGKWPDYTLLPKDNGAT